MKSSWSFGCGTVQDKFLRCDHLGSSPLCDDNDKDNNNGLPGTTTESCQCYRRLFAACHSTQLATFYKLKNGTNLECAVHAFFDYVNCFESAECANQASLLGVEGGRYMADAFEMQYRLVGMDDIRCYPLSNDVANVNPCQIPDESLDPTSSGSSATSTAAPQIPPPMSKPPRPTNRLTTVWVSLS